MALQKGSMGYPKKCDLKQVPSFVWTIFFLKRMLSNYIVCLVALGCLGVEGSRKGTGKLVLPHGSARVQASWRGFRTQFGRTCSNLLDS